MCSEIKNQKISKYQKFLKLLKRKVKTKARPNSPVKK